MARLFAPFTLSGTLGGLVTYQRKDIPGTLVRTASCLSSERFHTDPRFANSRRTAAEGGGRSKAARALRRVLHPLSPVRDHNWQGALTGALAAVQHRDGDSPWGRRCVRLSRHGFLLEGYCLSRRTPFEALLRSPLSFALDKPSGSATLDVPELTCGVNLWVRSAEPYFRVVAALGAVSDRVYTPEGYAPQAGEPPAPLASAYAAWHPVRSGAPAHRLELRLPRVPAGEDWALVLAVGVVLGTPDPWGALRPVPYRGSGRILKVV